MFMKAPRNDFCQAEYSGAVPQWHVDMLDERENQIAQGAARFTDWETAKNEIAAAVLHGQGGISGGLEASRGK